MQKYLSLLTTNMMSGKENEEKMKDNDVTASDDTLGENTEQTPLAEKVKKDRQAVEKGKKDSK